MIARENGHRLLAEQPRVLIGSSAAEEVLRRVHQTVRRVALISTDERGIITSFNRAAELLTGYSADEVVGCHTPLLFHHPEEIAARRVSCGASEGDPVTGYEIFTRDATADGVDEVQCTYRCKDGTETAVYLAIHPLVRLGDEDASAPGFLSLVRLVPNECPDGPNLPLRAFGGPVFEPPNEGVIEYGRDWTILYCNDRAKKIVPSLALSANLWELYPGLVGTFVEDHLQRAMKERVRTSYENFYDPLGIWFRVHALPSPSGIRLLFQDITAAKQVALLLEQEKVLREKRIEAISHMAGGLAHEISNPLAIINMMAGDLEAFAAEHETIDAAEVKTTCAIIVETSNRAMAILRGLKGFTREASQDPMVEASLPKIIEECVQLQRSRFERNGIDLRVEMDGEVPAITCREVQIGQILNNLLNNAFDAIVATITSSRAFSGWVCIRTTVAANQVQVDVTDSGPGVPEEAKPHLMEPFFTTKEVGGGTGIGLSLSRAIAEGHGGTLVLVEHDGPTCFRLVLPVTPARSPADTAA